MSCRYTARTNRNIMISIFYSIAYIVNMNIYKKIGIIAIGNKNKNIYRKNNSRVEYVLHNKEYIRYKEYIKQLNVKKGGGGEKRKAETVLNHFLKKPESSLSTKHSMINFNYYVFQSDKYDAKSHHFLNTDNVLPEYLNSLQEYVNNQLVFIKTLDIKSKLLLRDYVYGATNYIIKHFNGKKLQIQNMGTEYKDIKSVVEYNIFETIKQRTITYHQDVDNYLIDPFYHQVQNMGVDYDTVIDENDNLDTKSLNKLWNQILIHFISDISNLFYNEDLPKTTVELYAYKGAKLSYLDDKDVALPNITSVSMDINIALDYASKLDDSALFKFIIPNGFNKLLFVECFNEGYKDLLEFILPKNLQISLGNRETINVDGKQIPIINVNVFNIINTT